MSRTPSQRTRGWRKTIALKQYLSADDSRAAARECARNIARVLMAQREYEEGGFDDFSVIAEELDGIAKAGESEHDADYSPTEHVNDCLAGLYDWADAERVWIA